MLLSKNAKNRPCSPFFRFANIIVKVNPGFLFVFFVFFVLTRSILFCTFGPCRFFYLSRWNFAARIGLENHRFGMTMWVHHLAPRGWNQKRCNKNKDEEQTFNFHFLCILVCVNKNKQFVITNGQICPVIFPPL